MQTKNALIDQPDWDSFSKQISELAVELGNRLDYLANSGICCPSCDTNQLQLISRRVPAKWKCRMCGYTFEGEP
jgi:transposase-like protein